MCVFHCQESPCHMTLTSKAPSEENQGIHINVWQPYMTCISCNIGIVKLWYQVVLCSVRSLRCVKGVGVIHTPSTCVSMYLESLLYACMVL